MRPKCASGDADLLVDGEPCEVLEVGIPLIVETSSKRRRYVRDTTKV